MDTNSQWLSIAALARGYTSMRRASPVPILNPLFLQTFQGRRLAARHGRRSWKESDGAPGHRESLCGRGRGQDRGCGEGGQVHLEALWWQLLGFVHAYGLKGKENGNDDHDNIHEQNDCRNRSGS